MYFKTSWTIEDPVRACAFAGILIIQKYEFSVKHNSEGTVFWIKCMKHADKIDRIRDAILKEKI